MAEDKDEEEVHRTSYGSSVEEGSFSSGLDTQISTIEDQLKKAQATLFELQSLRGNLEAEKQRNLLRAKEEQEHLESLRIKQENDRLRHELKDYHGEIGNLKEIISSLKDDLVKTAEKLEKKVNHTLHELGEDEIISHSHHHARKSTSHHSRSHSEDHSRNFFTDHIEAEAFPMERPVDLTQDIISAPAPRQAAEDREAPTAPPVVTEEIKEELTPAAGPSQAEPPSAVVSAPIAEAAAEPGGKEEAESVAPATPAPTQSEAISQSAPAATEAAPADTTEESTPTPAPATAAPATPETQPTAATAPAATPAPQQTEAPVAHGEESVLDKFLGDNSASIKVEPVQVTNIENQLTAEDIIDDDFDEYEDIKKELEALENESIFKPAVHVDEVSTEVKAEAKTPEHKKNLLSLFGEKKKIVNAEQFKEHFWGKKKKPKEAEELAPEAVAENVNIQPATADDKAVKEQSVAEEVKIAEAPAPAENAPQGAAVEPEAPVAVVEEAKPEPVSVQEEPAPETIKSNVKNSIAKLNKVFQKRTKKVTGETELDRIHEKPKEHRGGGGKLAIGAAVLLLIAGLGTAAFRITNADKLRDMYISKARESAASTKVKDVPDGFNDIDPTVKYREAYADVPFDKTEWVNYKDSDLGITVDYPQNTSYRLKPVGSTNLWFLRKDGYLLKIEKVVTNRSLEDFSQDITSTVKYTSEIASVRDHDTMHLVLQDDLPVRGNFYLVKMDANTIYKIWYKTYTDEENPDDEQRVKKMLDSLDFITPHK